MPAWIIANGYASSTVDGKCCRLDVVGQERKWGRRLLWKRTGRGPIRIQPTARRSNTGRHRAVSVRDCGGEPGLPGGSRAGCRHPVNRSGRRSPCAPAKNFRKQFAQNAFLGAPAGRGRSRPAARVFERFAVQLTVGRQWQRIQDHKRRGHHVIRQPSSQVQAQVSGSSVAPGAGTT